MTMQQTPPAREDRDRRSGAVVAALEESGLVPLDRHDEAVAVVDNALAGQVAESAPLRRRLAELAGYLGGALVVAAGALFVTDRWTDLTVGQQTVLLVGVAVVLFASGLAIGVTGGGFAALRAGRQPVRRRLAGVLFTAGAVATAAATTVWLIDWVERRGSETEDGPLIGVAGALTLAVLALVGYLLAHTTLGQVAVAFGVAYAVPFAFDWFGDVEPLPVGLVLVTFGLVWLALAERGLWREVMAARVIGSLFVVVGAQIPVGSDAAWVGYLLTLLVAVGGFAVYVVRRAWPYLAVGVVGVTLAVPEALLDWTEGSLGPAGVLLVAGVTLLGASLLGLRLRREVGEPGR